MSYSRTDGGWTILAHWRETGQDSWPLGMLVDREAYLHETGQLVDEVVFLDPASAVFEAMLDGWARQQRTRGLAAATVGSRVGLVRWPYEFSNLYPWQRTCAEVEAFFDRLRSGDRSLALS